MNIIHDSVVVIMCPVSSMSGILFYVFKTFFKMFVGYIKFFVLHFINVLCYQRFRR